MVQIAILRLQEKLYLTLAEENYSEANDTLKQLVAKKMNDPSNTETDFTETKINVPLISDAMNEKHLESVLDKYSNACIDAYNKGNTAVAETLRTQVARKQSALARLKRHNAIIKMRSSHTKFTRPTPKPIRTFRSAYARWTLPGVNKRIEDGFPTRAEIARDCRDYALGIGNGYGTGKTELALAGIRVLVLCIKNVYHSLKFVLRIIHQAPRPLGATTRRLRYRHYVIVCLPVPLRISLKLSLVGFIYLLF